jgi:hypothetical protein
MINLLDGMYVRECSISGGSMRSWIKERIKVYSMKPYDQFGTNI